MLGYGKRKKKRAAPQKRRVIALPHPLAVHHRRGQHGAGFFGDLGGGIGNIFGGLGGGIGSIAHGLFRGSKRRPTRAMQQRANAIVI